MASDAGKTITLRLPTDLIDALDAAAKERVVSRGWLVKALLREALPRLVPVAEIRMTAAAVSGPKNEED